MTAPPEQLAFDVLAVAVICLDRERHVRYMNPSAENLFRVGAKIVHGEPLSRLVRDPVPLSAVIDHAQEHGAPYTQYDLELVLYDHETLEVHCTVTPTDADSGCEFVIEMSPLQQQLRFAREEQLQELSRQNRDLIRNLAHEIKNPLGALRGAAQLLDAELERPELHEYTQVIMQEADRLRSLMDRLLTPHRLAQVSRFGIHEALERVRSLVAAEYPEGIALVRDYDLSLPDITGDKEQIIQALLNIARNAAQALEGHGMISFRSRVARRVTLARRLHKLAVTVQVVDNGPGIPEELHKTLFLPLVSRREGGTGLGLAIAQGIVAQHQGTIEFDSRPGQTSFSLTLPIVEQSVRAASSAR
jgi:two-component system, NtrC family, nitrogen regulation sensor histidine kinase GlnL